MHRGFVLRWSPVSDVDQRQILGPKTSHLCQRSKAVFVKCVLFTYQFAFLMSDSRGRVRSGGLRPVTAHSLADANSSSLEFVRYTNFVIIIIITVIGSVLGHFGRNASTATVVVLV